MFQMLSREIDTGESFIMEIIFVYSITNIP